MRPLEGAPPPVALEFVESSGRSVGRSGEFATHGCVLSTGLEFNGERSVAAVSLRAVTSKGRVGSAEVMVHAEAAGEAGAFLVEAFCLHADPDARQALLTRLRAICDGGPDPARRPAAAVLGM